MLEYFLPSDLKAQLDDLLREFIYLLPEILIALFCVVLLLFDLFFKVKNAFLYWIAALSFVVIYLFLLIPAGFGGFQGRTGEVATILNATLSLGKPVLIFKYFFALSVLLTLLISWPLIRKKHLNHPAEYIVLIFALWLGIDLLIMARHLLLLYLALELVSISSYILTAFLFQKKSMEGSLKYLLFGAFSSGFMLYGMSLLYGFGGSLHFESFLSSMNSDTGAAQLIALMLTSIGLLFKISVFPFHLWAPDAYEAAPTPIAAFLSVAPKAAGLFVLYQFTTLLLEKKALFIQWQLFLTFISLFSILLGNFSALWQNNIKRMLAYSSIAQAGFLLIAIISLPASGFMSLVFYLFIYQVMNFAAFYQAELIALKLKTDEEGDRYLLRNYDGLGLQHTFLGISFLITMIALTGLPPTAGFNAKLFLFSSLWESYLVSGQFILLFLFILGLLNAAVALFYYIKIPYFLFFKPSNKNDLSPLNLAEKALIFLFVLTLILFFFRSDWLLQYIQT